MNGHVILFTDLDGTLLDSSYSFKKALSSLRLIQENSIPLIVCSSKTRAEIEQCRERLNNEHPFIAENGGGIFIPKDYFAFQISKLKFRIEREDDYYVMRLGASYTDLRNVLRELQSEGFDVHGFGDMKVTEIAGLTGLNVSDARRAKQRDFDEPFLFSGDRVSVNRLKRRIKALGFNYTQGEFFHIMGNSDKGRAVEILKDMFKKQYGKIITVALGDSPNDIEMLQKVDYPVVVQKNNGRYHPQVLNKVKGIIKAGGAGPEGWNRAVTELISSLGIH